MVNFIFRQPLKKSQIVILTFILFFSILYLFAKLAFTPERTAKLVASRLERISGKSVALKELKLKNSSLHVKGIKIKDPFFSLEIESFFLQPGLWDLIRKKKIKTVLLEKPILQIKLHSHPIPGEEKLPQVGKGETKPINLPESIKIINGKIILLVGKKKIKISGLDAEIDCISPGHPWNWRISGRLNGVHFSLIGKVNPLQKKAPIDLQVVFERLPAIKGGIKIAGCLKNRNSFNGRIDLKNIDFRISDYSSLKNLNGYLRITKNSILENPIVIEKIDYHRLEIYNVTLPISYNYAQDILEIKDFTYEFYQGKGRGKLKMEGLISKKNHYHFFTEISDINLENFCEGCEQPNLISGILECRFETKGEGRKFPEVSASFSTVKKQGIKQAISFRGVEKIFAFAGGSSIKGKLMDYPYEKLAGSFRIKNRNLTLRGDVKRWGKEYLLLGPFFGRSINVLIDPMRNTISIDDLSRRLKRVAMIGVSSQVKVKIGGE